MTLIRLTLPSLILVFLGNFAVAAGDFCSRYPNSTYCDNSDDFCRKSPSDKLCGRWKDYCDDNLNAKACNGDVGTDKPPRPPRSERDDQPVTPDGTNCSYKGSGIGCTVKDSFGTGTCSCSGSDIAACMRLCDDLNDDLNGN